MRLLRNKVYMWNLLSGVIALLAFAGMGTFFPKYLEYHFRQTPSNTGLSSLGTSLGTGLGILLGGLLITKFRFRARVLAGWQVVQGILGTLALITFGFMACPPLEVSGLASSCSSACSCSDQEFSPTCSMDGVTLFFSPCSAGCQTRTTVTVGEEEKIIFEDCSCVREMSLAMNLTLKEAWWLGDEVSSLPSPAIVKSGGAFISGAVEGFCPSEDCENIFFLTMLLVGFVSFLGSTARVGSSIINLRAVEPQVSKVLHTLYNIILFY